MGMEIYYYCDFCDNHASFQTPEGKTGYIIYMCEYHSLYSKDPVLIPE